LNSNALSPFPPVSIFAARAGLAPRAGRRKLPLPKSVWDGRPDEWRLNFKMKIKRKECDNLKSTALVGLEKVFFDVPFIASRKRNTNHSKKILFRKN